MKNLSRRASAAQLVALFSRFERENRPPVVYRLLTGRMAGQAFVTLPGESAFPQVRRQPATGVNLRPFALRRRGNGPGGFAAGPRVSRPGEALGAGVWSGAAQVTSGLFNCTVSSSLRLH